MSLTQNLLLTVFVLSSVLFLLPAKSNAVNKKYVWIVYFLVLMIVVFRSDNMADYNAYSDGLEGGDSGIRLEPSFHLIKYIAGILGNPTFWGIFIYAVIGVSLKFSFIYNHCSWVWASVIIYMSETLITHDMVAIRAGVAAAILLYMACFKSRISKWKQISLMILAFLFHYSALSFVLLFFVSPHKIQRKLYLGALVICHIMGIMGIFLSQYIGFLAYFSALETVVEMNEAGEVMNFLNLIQLGHIIMCVFFWLHVKKIQDSNENALVFLKLYTIGLCVMPLLAEMISMAIRLSELFLVVEIVLVPTAINSIFGHRKVGKFLILLYASIFFFINLTSEFYWSN